jgi:tetratricopeptide (TPR) repeat protein
MSKLCIKCGNQLDEDYFCTNCDMKIDIYEKIQNTSKLLYNQGLQKAKLRDLSGAISVLKRSLKLDKKNIDARNLLGLVYFEIGEVVPALQQWVISKHIQEENNIAEYYLEKIHRNQHKLDTLNTAIKKYNLSIGYIQQNSTDLAIIQLKKVISLNPKFIKAYCLLALCYINENNIARAKKILLKVLSIDKNNYIALKYYEDITTDNEEEENIHIIDKQEEVYSGNSVVKENRISPSILQFAYVIFGIIIGLLVAVFLVVPGKVKGKTKEADDLKKQILVMQDEYESKEKTLNAQISQLKLELDNKDKIVNDYKDKEANYEAMSNLQEALSFSINDDELSAANKLFDTKKDNLLTATSIELYNKLRSEIYPKVSSKAFNNGKSLYNRGKNSKNKDTLNTAISQFQLSSKFAIGDEHHLDDLLYYEARCNQLLNRKEEAISLFEKLLSRYPKSTFKGWTQSHLNSLKK